MNSIENLINNYYNWLKTNTLTKEIGEFTEITTPFLDRHNDCIQLYVKRESSNTIYISDDAYTLNDLQSSGIPINTPKRKKLLEEILISYGIQRDNDELYVKGTEKDFPLLTHFFLQAIQSINNLCYTSKNTVDKLFFDDVTNYFEQYEIPVISNFHIMGQSGLLTKIDFGLAKSKFNPERYIQLINHITSTSIRCISYGLIDLQKTRKNTKMIVFINDQKSNVKSEYIDAFSKYDIMPILWSQRERQEILNLLTA